MATSESIINGTRKTRRPRIVLSVDEVIELLNNAKTFLSDILYPFLYTTTHTSPRKIQEELSRVMRVKIKNKISKTEVILPTQLTEVQKLIYSALKITPEIIKAKIL